MLLNMYVQKYVCVQKEEVLSKRPIDSEYPPAFYWIADASRHTSLLSRLRLLPAFLMDEANAAAR